jgi:U3 small nucleolar RNA-associated protein 5
MVSKKNFKATASKVSSKTDLAASSRTQVANKSSVLQTAFSPSWLQLHWFASVIKGLDSQHLRIHDTATGRLCCHHAITSKGTVSCLDWGSYRQSYGDGQAPSKKRKRDGLVNGSELGKGTDVVIAYGTSDSEIKIFSPAQARIVGALGGVHTQGIKDFKFSNDRGKCPEGWSVGGDGKLVQWDVRKGTSIR